ncbi:MAG: hypothetical protein H0V81_17960 [Solirubrobacterales bacterium]|nr:hypothetical protein [Solirubrobacterales bacterium]
MPVRRLITALALAAALGGCGKERTKAPDVATPGPPLGSNASSFPAAGLEFAAPAGWDLQPGTPPLVATITTGRATIAVYRYPRTEPLPRTKGELDDAAAALAGAALQRDTTYKELARGRLEVDGKPAVVLRATETVGDQPRTVRSTHVYAFDGEVVVDAFAPAADFKRVDEEAFRPFVRSLMLSKPAG